MQVIVIGGGAAGLTAACELGNAGHRITLLEASARLGGRVHTLQTEAGPIELGAEFVHGKPPVLRDLIKRHRLALEGLDGDALRSIDGKLIGGSDFFPKVMKLLNELRTNGSDRTFAEFLQDSKQKFDAETRDSAMEYVAGFHAAHPEMISEHALAKSTKTGEKEGSDEAFRLIGGYSDVVEVLRKSSNANCDLYFGAHVVEVSWKKGEVRAITMNGQTFTGDAAFITIPLPIWSQLKIDPDLPHKRAALEKLAMGAVVRISIQFDSTWWQHMQGGKAKDLSFLFSHHPDFPTWWRGTSAQKNVLTGWCAAHRAERLSHLSEHEIRDRALDALADLFAVPRSEVTARFQNAWTHDWQADPFIGGAYSYVLKNGEAAPRILAAPVEGTLFIAGEATDFFGDNGTVHAAMASGIRAAREFIASLP